MKKTINFIKIFFNRLVAFIGPTAFYVKLTKNRGVYFYSALVLLLFSIICAGLAVFGIIVYKASSSWSILFILYKFYYNHIHFYIII